MTEGHNEMRSRIDAYLDDVMSPDERLAFERRAAMDDALRAELLLQTRIDARLRALASVPEFPGVPHARPVADGAMGRGGGSRVIPAWIKVAAVLVIGVLGVWGAVAKPWQSLLGPAPSLVAADAVYNRLVRTGFEPAWVCENDAKFLEYTGKELGSPFLVKPDAGVQLVGWTYADGLLGDGARVLLVKKAEKHVIVVMDRKANDRAVRVEPGSTLKVHRGTIGDVVMYEIGPEDGEVVIGHIAAQK